MANMTVTRSDGGVAGSSRLTRFRCSWTTDSASGTFDLQTPGYIICVDTDPGTVAPTDNYDIAITNDLGIDLCGTSTLNRDTTTAERVRPLDANSLTSIEPAMGTITVAVTNAGASAGDGTANIIDIYVAVP